MNKSWVLYTSCTGKEYAKLGKHTFKCCRKEHWHKNLSAWIWVGSIKRYVSPTPY